MNLFVLSTDPVEAAQMMCDQHVVKMPTETAQMLSTVGRKMGLQAGYRSSHALHPCTIWIGDSLSNFRWAVAHGIALCEEYTYRYGRVHGARKVIDAVNGVSGPLVFPEEGPTPFAQAMPDIYKGEDPVKAYRAYYLGSKVRFARWRKARGAPGWWVPLG